MFYKTVYYVNFVDHWLPIYIVHVAIIFILMLFANRQLHIFTDI